MATKTTNDPDCGPGERLVSESWRLGRTPSSDRRLVEECLEKRAEALDEIVQRIAEGRAGQCELQALMRCLEEGNALLAAWREDRAAIQRELAKRRTEVQFLQAGLAEQGSAGRRTLRG